MFPVSLIKKPVPTAPDSSFISSSIFSLFCRSVSESMILDVFIFSSLICNFCLLPVDKSFAVTLTAPFSFILKIIYLRTPRGAGSISLTTHSPSRLQSLTVFLVPCITLIVTAD